MNAMILRLSITLLVSSLQSGWCGRLTTDRVLVDFYQYLVGGVSEDDLRKNKDVVGWINVKDGKS